MASVKRQLRELRRDLLNLTERCQELASDLTTAEEDIAFLLRERNTGGRPVGSTPPAAADVSRETSKINSLEDPPAADVSRETSPSGDVMARARRARGGRGGEAAPGKFAEAAKKAAAPTKRSEG